MAVGLPDHSQETGSETVYRCQWTFLTDQETLSKLNIGEISLSFTQNTSCCSDDVIVEHDVNNQPNDVIGNAQNMTTTNMAQTDKMTSEHC